MSENTRKFMISHLLYGDKHLKLCRLCLEVTDGSISLYDLVNIKTGDGTETITPLKNVFFDVCGYLNIEDNLPLTVCGKCTESIICFYEFRINCKQISDLWEDTLKKLEMLPDESPKSVSTIYLFLKNEYAIVNCDEHKISKRHLKEAVRKASMLRYECTICNKSFKNKKALKTHTLTKHLIENSCQNCGQKFKSKKKLLHHQKECATFDYEITIDGSYENFSKSKHKDKIPSYICDCCGKQFKNLCNLNRHKENHPKQCPNCSRSYKSAASFEIHKKLCTATEPYQPLQPKKKLDYKKMGNTFVCDYCGSSCISKASLASHIKSLHLFPKSVQCQVCGKRFNTKGHLKGHMVVHTGERSQKCHICESYFVTKAALVYHMRLHTGEKPYSCEMCDEKFINSSRRAEHMRRKHKGRSLFCTICCASFYSSSSLKRHVKKHYQPNSKLYKDNLSHLSLVEIPIINATQDLQA